MLAAEVLRRCRETGVRLALVEACTGGLVCARLTEVPGASAVVERSFIPYSNESKVEQLGVPLELLVTHGSVSAEALARAALERSRADWAMAETGIAGPGGGTPQKPVGLAFLAVLRRGGRATSSPETGAPCAAQSQTARSRCCWNVWEPNHELNALTALPDAYRCVVRFSTLATMSERLNP
ncbi:competence/damage-inducible protein CinA domain protein [Melittangium boletus DSM 14713]|uniref:Competence/damage-inducible protein CinA domain protein n=1 Tax=Melittangium boletus DSM 14713 TaxID=1294270 RepID=A0A250I7C7_9BACT|nr:competence/damage-inducible protein CinA domain protein [Melittangium boletus DSM 14713]